MLSKYILYHPQNLGYHTILQDHDHHWKTSNQKQAYSIFCDGHLILTNFDSLLKISISVTCFKTASVPQHEEVCNVVVKMFMLFHISKPHLLLLLLLLLTNFDSLLKISISVTCFKTASVPQHEEVCNVVVKMFMLFHISKPHLLLLLLLLLTNFDSLLKISISVTCFKTASVPQHEEVCNVVVKMFMLFHVSKIPNPFRPKLRFIRLNFI